MDIHEVKEDPERKIEVLSIQNVMERTMDIYEVEHNSLNSVLLSPPSYLRAVHFSDVDTGKIELVFLKGHSHDHIAPKAELISPDPSNDTILDVTGSPLEVDLKGNESFTKYEKEEVHQWSEEESRHFPTDIKRARNYINQQMRIKKRGPEPIFVVCDGDNPQGTVLLGVKKTNRSIYTSILNVVGCYPNDHEKLSLDEMEKSHQILTRSRSSKINYQTKFKYYVFGNPLQNVKDIYRAEHPGSISIEIRCNKRCHLDLPQNTPNIKNMVLQTIAGHKMSSVYFLWKDLCLLQEYLDIFLSNKGDRLLSPVPLSAVEVFQSIKTIVGTNFWKREAKTKFDLKHIRHENILDKLWGILKYCEDLATLRDAFHCLFEELAETDSNFKIPDSQKCNIAIIINGIIEGKFAVPTLTFYQALEFLFEIGAEKLKNDYQSIIKHFYSTSDSTIAAKWSQLEKKLFPEDSNNKTRVTLNLKGAKADVNNVHSKLAYLSRLHVATELIYLVKNHLFLQADAFDCICERIYKQYVARDASNYDFLALQDNPLCEFETVIDTPNETVIKTELPVSWSMQMTSSLDNLEVTTVYHLSKHPIIPTTIFNNYDVSTADEDSMPYYVCKFESHKEVI